jgi:hypothetical protein
MMLVGDTGFEPVTSSVSDMGNTSAGIRASTSSLVSGTCIPPRTSPYPREHSHMATHLATFRGQKGGGTKIN